MQMKSGANQQFLSSNSVLNFELRNCSLNPKHPITDADVRLYVLLPIFPFSQLFAQSCHEYSQRSNIIFPTAAPKSAA